MCERATAKEQASQTLKKTQRRLAEQQRVREVREVVRRSNRFKCESSDSNATSESEDEASESEMEEDAM